MGRVILRVGALPVVVVVEVSSSSSIKGRNEGYNSSKSNGSLLIVKMIAS